MTFCTVDLVCLSTHTLVGPAYRECLPRCQGRWRTLYAMESQCMADDTLFLEQIPRIPSPLTRYNNPRGSSCQELLIFMVKEGRNT